jgi:hypothetical protein
VFTPALLIAWVIAAPFGACAVIARSSRFRRACAQVYPLSLLAGWFGLALLAAGANLLDGPIAAVALAAGGPLAGLSMWSRRFDDEDDGGESDPSDDPPPPDGGFDWDEFERKFRDHVARGPRERVPVAG